MREIKYRGLTVKTKRWAYGYYCKASNRDLIIQIDAKLVNPCGGLVIDPCPDYYINKFVEVFPETVGQFTGLKDKKRTKEYPEGQEIYDGDFLKRGLEDKLVSIVEVVWTGRGWGYMPARPYDYGDLTREFLQHSEVIGNIHENPELSEEDKNGKS